MNPYIILGLDPSCNEDDIKMAYRRKSKECHPDKGGTDEDFIIVNQAYKILSDPDKRRVYDLYGKLDDTVEDILDVAETCIKQLVVSYIQLYVDDTSKDLITEIVGFSIKNKRKCTDLIKENTSKIAKYHRFLGRIRSKTNKQLLQSIVAAQIENLKQSNLQQNYQIKVNDEIINIIQNYSVDEMSLTF